jgi:hypothetical protein
MWESGKRLIGFEREKVSEISLRSWAQPGGMAISDRSEKHEGRKSKRSRELKLCKDG